MLYHPLAGIGVADLDSGPRKRNNFAGFGVFLLEADEGGKGGVIEDEIIGFFMFGNEHGEIRDKFLPLGAFGLMHHIQAVWKVLRLGKTMGIGNQKIPFGFFGIFIASGAGKVNLEFCAFFRLLHLAGVSVFCGLIGMLGNGDAAEDNVFCDSHGDVVALQRKIPRLCAYRVDGFI